MAEDSPKSGGGNRAVQAEMPYQGAQSHDVFVSYASQDGAVANAVVEALEKQGIRCWIAPRDVTPGALYADGIIRAINDARVLVLVLSASSTASPHVGKEVERASSKRRPIIALKVDAAPLTRALEYFLSESQWIDVGAEGVSTAASKLVEAVRRHLDPTIAAEPHAHPDPPTVIPTGKVLRARWMMAAGVAVVCLALAYFAVEKMWLPRRVAEQKPVAVVVPGTGPASPAIPDKSVAVLPFVDMSEKKDQEYFSDGLSEELIDMLTRLQDLRVPARTSSFYFKGKQTTIADIARILSVAHVLEGSVRKSGNSLRITAQLIRVDNGYHEWSQTYDRKLDDIFKIQDEIANAVVSALKVSLLGGSAPATVGTSNTGAYTLYLQARSIFQLGTKASYETALEYLQKAIILDPTFAAAWADVAKVRVRQWDGGYLPLKQATDEARQAAKRALALDPQLSAAHLSMGRVHYMFDWDWLTSEADMKRAIELDPGNADAFRWAAFVVGTLGRFDEALALAQQAVSKDPLEPFNYIAIGALQYRTGRYAEADTTWRKARELNPEVMSSYAIGMILLARGDAAAALAVFATSPEYNWGPALAYHALGRKAESDAALARLITLRADDSAMAIAEIFAYRGENERAFEWLDRAYRQHDSDLRGIKGNPLLKNLESDPRYNALLRKMKLPVRPG
jgi:TolB-like protein/Flp pilus assembly protein TadD